MKDEVRINRPKIRRFLKIHELINEGSFPTAEKLASETSNGVSTIYGDVSILKNQFKAPIAYNAQKRGYYYSKPYELPFNNLNDSDMEVLASAKVLLSHLEGNPIYNELNEITQILAPDDKNGSPMINRIAVPPVAKASYDKSLWDDIYTAMKTNQIVEFDYDGLNDETPSHRRVHPYQLLMNDGQVFLFGYSEEREAERIFSLTRMSNLEIKDDQFELPANIEFSDRCGPTRFGFFVKGEEKKFRIRFFGESKEIIKENIWAADQEIVEKEDYLDLTFTSNQENKVLDWILTFADSVKPIEPPSLVKLWKDSLSDMLTDMLKFVKDE